MTIKTKIKKLIKQIAFWTLPLGLQQVAQSLISYNKNRLSQANGDILKQNRKLRDIHQGKRCFILATGPSINAENLKPLKNEFCIAVSNFYLHPDFNLIAPHYYCVAPWHPPHKIEDYLQLLQEIGSTSTKHSFCLGLGEYERVISNKILLNRNVYYQCTRAKKLDKEVDLCLPVLSPQSVTIMALQLAIFMGFSEIYLLGCDHNAILNYSGGFSFKHFYPEQKSKLITDRASKFKDSLITCTNLWEQYEMLNAIAQEKNIKIFNATKHSLLDVFDKVDYESLFTL
jgi:hypothetical protein